MARASTRTWLSLDRYAAIMGLHPAHFNGVYSTTFPDTACSAIWFQYAWQDAGKIAREDLAVAIHDAERMIADQVGYYLLPDWTADERQPTVRPFRRELLSYDGMNVRGLMKSCKTRWAWVITGGIKAKTLIESRAAVVRSDADGDGYSETCTVTSITAVAANEIRVFYTGTSGDDTWEVRPITVTKAGNIATITFKVWQIPLEDLWDAMNASGIDGDVAANFYTAVDVYRVYNDPQQQVYFLWEEPSCSTCGGTGCTACEQGTQTGCLVVRDTRLGQVSYHPATWDADTSTFTTDEYTECREPDKLRLWYYSGWMQDGSSFPYSVMDPYWERAVAYLATALLPRPLCDCDCHSNITEHWREDLALVNASRSYQAQQMLLGNTFGTMRGCVYAWNAANAETRKVVR